jgi:hypothetical protein
VTRNNQQKPTSAAATLVAISGTRMQIAGTHFKNEDGMSPKSLHLLIRWR